MKRPNEVTQLPVVEHSGILIQNKNIRKQKMNKMQFVELVQTKGSYKTKVEAENAINAFTEAVTEALATKETVSLIGFGTFETTLLRGKTGKIPGKDASYTTKDKTIPKFKAGKSLKDSVAATI